MTLKKYYYIGVRTENGMRFVTGIPERNWAEWNKDEKPKCFTKQMAEDIVYGLNKNFITAVVIQSYIEFDKHYFEAASPDEQKQDEQTA